MHSSARPILVCLHGWGGSKESFTELRAALKGTDIEILTPDLPGFGAEPEPNKPWTTDDYADWVSAWIKQKLVTRNSALVTLHVLGHSHGGRIALKLAHRQSLGTVPTDFTIDRLFLCASAGIRHPRHFKRIIGLTLAKTGKFFLRIPGLRTLEPAGKKLLYKLVRVHDYEDASPIMRQTLINVSAEDLKPLLKHITIPTDIFWGREDRMTPVSDAAIIHKAIRGSTLQIFDQTRHGVHRDRATEIAKTIQDRHVVV